MTFTLTPADTAPVKGLKIVKLDGETITHEFDVSLTDDGLLVGEIDGTTYLLGVPITYDRNLGVVGFSPQTEGGNVFFAHNAPDDDTGMVNRFWDNSYIWMDIFFEPRAAGDAGRIHHTVFDVANNPKNVWLIHRGTGRVTHSQPPIFTPQSEPSNPSEGMFYMDASAHKLRYYNGSGWQTVATE